MPCISGFKFSNQGNDPVDFDDVFVRKDVFAANQLWGWGSMCMEDGCNLSRSVPVQSFALSTQWKSISPSAGISDGGVICMPGSSAGGLNGTQAKCVSSTRNADAIAFIKPDNTLWLCGPNSGGQIGINTTTTATSPVQTIAGGTWCDVNINFASVGAIKTDGTLWMWGCNQDGALGDSAPAFDFTNLSSPVQTVAGGSNWAVGRSKIARNNANGAGIKTDGTLWVWGQANYGALGNNQYTPTQSSPVQTISGGTNWCAISVGSRQMAAIKTDGTLWLWGKARYGALGTNATIHRSSPVQTIAGGTTWCSVSIQNDSTGAIKTDGTLWMWGCGYRGVLGDNTGTCRSSPVQTIAGGTNWCHVDVVGGFVGSTVGIKTDGTLWMWGSHCYGKLGNSTTIGVSSSPIQTTVGGANWVCATTGFQTTFALKADGTMWSWGRNYCGSLAINSAATQIISCPVQVGTGTTWCALGGLNQWALKSDNTLWGWGLNFNSSLGDCSFGSRLCPVQILSTKTWCAASTATGVTSTGERWSWGCNSYLSAGNGISGCVWPHRSSPVQTVAGGTNWKQVAASTSTSAAIKTDGTLWTWGSNANGQLGNNSTFSRSSPVQTIAGGTNWKQVAVQNGPGTFMSAIKTDGTLWVWGCNRWATVANGTAYLHRSSPVQTVAGGTSWKCVSAGYCHVAAIKTDGTLWTWGARRVLGVGAGPYDNQCVGSPVQTISGGTGWIAVASHRYGTRALCRFE